MKNIKQLLRINIENVTLNYLKKKFAYNKQMLHQNNTKSFFPFALFSGTPSTPIMPGGTPGTPSSKAKVSSHSVEIETSSFLAFLCNPCKFCLVGKDNVAGESCGGSVSFSSHRRRRFVS